MFLVKVKLFFFFFSSKLKITNFVHVVGYSCTPHHLQTLITKNIIVTLHIMPKLNINGLKRSQNPLHSTCHFIFHSLISSPKLYYYSHFQRPLPYSSISFPILNALVIDDTHQIKRVSLKYFSMSNPHTIDPLQNDKLLQLSQTHFKLSLSSFPPSVSDGFTKTTFTAGGGTTFRTSEIGQVRCF